MSYHFTWPGTKKCSCSHCEGTTPWNTHFSASSGSCTWTGIPSLSAMPRV